jgi:hypothetical protein
MRDYHPDDYERRENPVHDAPTACERIREAREILEWARSLDGERLTFEEWQRREAYAELLAF